MQLWRRILTFPLTRLVIWALVTGVATGLFGLVPLPLVMQGSHMAAAVVVGLVVLARYVERRPLNEVGLSARHWLRDTLLGFLVGGGLLALVIGLMALGGWYRSGPLRWDTLLVMAYLYHFLMVGIIEEVAARAVFFRVLEESLGSWVAIALSALAFGLMHLMNPNASLTASLAIAVEAGILLAAAFMLTRSVWLAVGIHWGWNFVQGPVFGAAVSGGQGRGLFRPVIEGPVWATGGAFGPEGGLIALVVCTAAGVAMLLWAVRRGQAVSGQRFRGMKRA